METPSCNLKVDSVGSNPEHILRGSQAQKDVTTAPRHLAMVGQLTGFCLTKLEKNQSSWLSQEESSDYLAEKQLEDLLKRLEDAYVPSSVTLYATLEHVQNMIKASLKLHEKIVRSAPLPTQLRERLLIYSVLHTKSLYFVLILSYINQSSKL